MTGISRRQFVAAADADAIKTYVKLGMGVGIVAQMAVENGTRDGLAIVRGSNRFFKPSSTKVAVADGALLRNYSYRLIGLLAPHLDERILKNGRTAVALSPGVPRSFSQRLDLRIGDGAPSEAFIPELLNQ